MFYLICSTPRVGSAVFNTLLRSTGRAGDPKEYFNRASVLQLAPPECGFASAEEVEHDLNRYFDAVARAYRVGGRFGLKAHFEQLAWALEHGFDLRAHLPDRVVFSTRGDLVGQAISLVRAQQTGAWNHTKGERREPRFDACAIGDAVRLLAAQNAGWETFFGDLGAEPYRLTYERLSADMRGELENVLAFLDVDPRAVDTARLVDEANARMRPQRDDLSAEWRARYHAHLRATAERSAGART